MDKQQMPPQPQPRMPNLDPQIYGLLNELDGTLAKTPLNRAETLQLQNTMGALVRRLEADATELLQLRSRLSEQAPPSLD